ncbi:MAG: alpha/beta fold hydrolase, partial [Acidimicrobiales bacterium]
TQGVAADESEPYRRALDDDDVLRTVFNYYRALPLWSRDPVAPVSMPTTFIWPTGSTNVSPVAVDTMPEWVTGTYTLHIIEDIHQPALQAAPEILTDLLLTHLSEHTQQ